MAEQKEKIELLKEKADLFSSEKYSEIEKEMLDYTVTESNSLEPIEIAGIMKMIKNFRGTIPKYSNCRKEYLDKKGRD